MLGCDLDIVIGAAKAEGKPFLALAAIAGLPNPVGEFRRQIVGEPAPALGDQLCLIGADLLLHLAPSRGQRLLAFIDPALGHLPGIGEIVDALADKDFAGVIEQHDSHPEAVRTLSQRLHRSGCWLTMALTGASAKLRSRR